jgi:hypothetical protein
MVPFEFLTRKQRQLMLYPEILYVVRNSKKVHFCFLFSEVVCRPYEIQALLSCTFDDDNHQSK